MNVYIAGSGSSALQKLEKFAAPVLIVLSFIVIIWGIRSADWSVSKLLSDPSPSKNFWTLFFPALSSMIAFDGGIALSMADFTKNCKTQKAQAVGQLVGAPVMTAFISFVGICGTAGAAISTVICHMIAVIIELKILNKNIDLKLDKKKFVFKPMLASIIMSVFAYTFYLVMITRINDKIVTLLSLLMCAIIYIVVLAILKIFSKEELFMIPFGQKIYYFLKKLGLYGNSLNADKMYTYKR